MVEDQRSNRWRRDIDIGGEIAYQAFLVGKFVVLIGML